MPNLLLWCGLGRTTHNKVVQAATMIFFPAEQENVFGGRGGVCLAPLEGADVRSKYPQFWPSPCPISSHVQPIECMYSVQGQSRPALSSQPGIVVNPPKMQRKKYTLQQEKLHSNYYK